MRKLLGAGVLFLAAAAFGAQRPPVTAAHYLVVESNSDDELSIVSRRLVELSGDLPPDEDEGGGPARGRERYSVTLRDGDGKKVWKTKVDVPRFRHAEWPGPGGAISGEWVELDEVTFALRVPAGIGDTLEITSPRTKKTATFSLAEVSVGAAFLESGPRVETIVSAEVTGPPSNRLDILLIGDGYTSAESSKFAADAAALANEFFSVTPYAEYRNYVNFTTYFVASAQSGADHPACSDPYKDFDPLEGTFRTTAFDARYCTNNIQRLLTVSDSKVLAAAGAVPDWDKVFVIVNDPMYGGAGGNVAVSSTNEYAVLVTQHEFGHSFTGLGDEYETPYPGFPSCNDAGSTKCEPNVTNLTTRAAVKWNPWIAGATPVPTPSDQAWWDVVGLFQGARYSPTAYYRPQYFCGMNGLGADFCAVCRQEYVLRLYRGWGGLPANGIDPIEPGTENPATATTVNAFVGTPATFGATILAPEGEPAPTIEWRVDNVVLAGQTSSTLMHAFGTTGAHTVKLSVTDATSLVNPTMALQGGISSLLSTRTWNVQVVAGAPAGFVAVGGASQVQLSWGAVSGATSYEIQRSTAGVGAFAALASSPTNSYTDTAVSSGSGYLYRVRAITAGGPGPWSAVDLATVFNYTDPTLIPGVTTAKAAHFTQLRTAVNAARSAVGLAPFSFTTQVSAGSTVLASQMSQLRLAANQARTAIALSSFLFSDTLTAGTTPIRGSHVLDVRSAIR